MRAHVREFDASTFSFRRDPILVLDGFWSKEERAQFQEAMKRGRWTALRDMPETSRAFPGCGNWGKAQIAPTEASLFMSRVAMPCIASYVESFPGIVKRHVSFAYYSYAAGDCLSTHDDTDQGYGAQPGQALPARRLALVTYLHDRWEPDWGGELIVYQKRSTRDGQPSLEATHCIAPEPGSLVIFSVPRFHRVARVDALAGENRRLSIAGWFMTES